MDSRLYLKKLAVSEEQIKKCSLKNRITEFEGKSVLKIWPDFEKINQDPDRFCVGLGQEELEYLTRLCSHLYYNTDESCITDNTYDTFRFYLEKIYKKAGKKILLVGAEPVSRLKSKLPFSMGSLEKVKPGTKAFDQFLSGIRKEEKNLFMSEKLDGVSALVYKGKMYTRGNGVVGADISFLLGKIKGVVNTPDPVRGELVVKFADFTKWNKLYSNARTFVSSRVNSISILSGAEDITFIAYDIPNSNLSSSAIYDSLETMGFTTPWHLSLKNPLSYDVVKNYLDRRKSSDYPIDGMVLSIDARGKRDSLCAFKMMLQEQIRDTSVINVEWNISRYGRYVPVAIYQNIYIGGSRLHRASAHNASKIKEWSMGSGTKIEVARSGDVIPQIVNVEVNAAIDPIYPSTLHHWKWAGKDIVLVDIDGNREVQIQKMVYFFTSLSIPRLRDATLTKLWDTGINTVEKVVNCQIDDFKKVKGIGATLASQFYHNINSYLAKIRPERLLIASSIFQGLGEKLIRTLYRYNPRIIFGEIEKRDIPGFGEKRFSVVEKNIPRLKAFLKYFEKHLDSCYKEYLERLKRARNDRYYESIKGKNIVFTGFMGNAPYMIEDFAYDHEVEISSAIDANTIAVVAFSAANPSTKMTEASSRKIPVFTTREFCELFELMFEEVEIN